MKKTTVTEPNGHPSDEVDDPLTEVFRSGAFCPRSYGPAGSIRAGIDALPVKQIKIRDRSAGEVCFTDKEQG